MNTRNFFRIATTIAFAASIHTACLAQTTAPAEVDLPDGKELVTKAAKAMGGGDAVDEKKALQHTTVMPDQMSGPDAPKSIVVTTASAWRFHMTARWADGRSAVMVYDGENLWGNDEDDPAMELKDGVELAMMTAFMPMLSPQGFGMRMPQMFDSFETTDVADVGDVECYVVEMTQPNRGTFEALVEKESGMFRGFSISGPGEQAAAEVIINEWADHEDGYKIIKKVEMSGMGPEPMTFTFSEYSMIPAKKRMWKRPKVVQDAIDAQSSGDSSGG